MRRRILITAARAGQRFGEHVETLDRAQRIEVGRGGVDQRQRGVNAVAGEQNLSAARSISSPSRSVTIRGATPSVLAYRRCIPS